MNELGQVLLVVASIAVFVALWAGVAGWWQRDRARRRAEQWARERPAWLERERRLNADQGLRPPDPD